MLPTLSTGFRLLRALVKHIVLDLGRCQFYTVPINLLSLLCSVIARKLNSKKKRLNNRWAGQLIFFRTPPQEQGTCSKTWNVANPTYRVKTVISRTDDRRPQLRVVGKLNSIAVMISTGGSDQIKIKATQFGTA